jgi:outer membrane protein, multidrug efflux system
VEDNLAAQNLLARQYEAESGALLAARKQLQIANNRYREGLVTFLEVATAESTELNVEFSTVQLRGQRLVAAVTLVKSLGGGWQEPMEERHQLDASAKRNSPLAARPAVNSDVQL